MYRNLELAKALSTLPLLKEVDELKHQIDALRPLPREVEERVLQKFRLDWNYHSNAIEGNPYTYGETVAFIIEGITAKGKTLKDHLDIKGHDDAIRYLLSIVKDKDYRLTEHDIRNLHKMLLKELYFSDAVTAEGIVTKKEIKLGDYKSMPNHVQTPTGEIHYYASPEETRIRMGDLVGWFNDISNEPEIHPVIVASLFHHEFTAIHPFDDGNGRMVRLLMNLILMQRGYPPVVIKQQDRNTYYQVLRQADVGEYQPLADYITEALLHSLDIYLKGARGESIDEVDDIDKEIALFKKEFSEDKVLLNKNVETIEYVLFKSILPLYNNINKKIHLLEDLFFAIGGKVTYEEYEGGPPVAVSLFDDSRLPSHLTSMTVNFDLIGFKKVDSPFDCKITIPWSFNDYYYETSYGGKMYKKKYSDFLTTAEITEITKYAINEVLKLIMSKSGNEQEKTK